MKKISCQCGFCLMLFGSAVHLALGSDGAESCGAGEDHQDDPDVDAVTGMGDVSQGNVLAEDLFLDCSGSGGQRGLFLIKLFFDDLILNSHSSQRSLFLDELFLNHGCGGGVDIGDNCGSGLFDDLGGLFSLLFDLFQLLFELFDLLGSFLFVKLFLGFYTIKKGKEAESVALVAVGTECRSDSFASIISIVSSLVFVIFGLSLDAYAGIIISLLIIKAGFDALKETIGDILGRPGDHDLAAKIYKEIKNTDGIISAADMILHNYGPDEWSGSVNVEIDHSKSVGEIYEFLHALQLRIMHEHHVTMVFGVYAVDNDRAETKELREAISKFVRNGEHLKSYHAVYRDTKNMIIYCDFIVDYELKDWDAVQESFKEYMSKLYPEYGIELTIETEFIS